MQEIIDAIKKASGQEKPRFLIVDTCKKRYSDRLKRIGFSKSERRKIIQSAKSMGIPLK
jgi:thioredoxin-related protein